MTYLLARLIVTLALLVLAGYLQYVTGDSAHDAITAGIIGAVIGYWLGQAEVTIPTLAKPPSPPQ